jgi:hypothetical protein
VCLQVQLILLPDTWAQFSSQGPFLTTAVPRRGDDTGRVVYLGTVVWAGEQDRRQVGIQFSMRTALKRCDAPQFLISRRWRLNVWTPRGLEVLRSMTVRHHKSRGEPCAPVQDPPTNSPITCQPASITAGSTSSSLIGQLGFWRAPAPSHSPPFSSLLLFLCSRHTFRCTDCSCEGCKDDKHHVPCLRIETHIACTAQSGEKSRLD